jgi:hypothetical protein
MNPNVGMQTATSLGYVNQFGAQSVAIPRSTAEVPPIARDMDNLSAQIACLEDGLENLRTRLDPVIRPVPDQGSVQTKQAAQLVSSRSSYGNTLEAFAERIGKLIQRVQYLQDAVEV